MKKLFNNLKPATLIKWSQIAALLLVLGFSLSWNPEYFQVARHEIVKLNSIELAATGENAEEVGPPKPEEKVEKKADKDSHTAEFDVSTFNPAKKGKVRFSVWKEQNGKITGTFNYTEANCETCSFPGTLSNFPATFLKNMDDAGMANFVYSQMLEQSTAKKAELKSEYVRDSGTDDEYDISDFSAPFTECEYDNRDRDLVAEKLACYREEMTELVQICEKIVEEDAKEENTIRKEEHKVAKEAAKDQRAQIKAERVAAREEAKTSGRKYSKRSMRSYVKSVGSLRTVEPKYGTCKKFSNRYYDKYLKTALKQGMRADPLSDQFEEAMSAADDMFSMDPRYANPLVQSIAQAAFEGLVNQAGAFCSSPYASMQSGLAMNSMSLGGLPRTDSVVSACMGQFVRNNGTFQYAYLGRNLDSMGLRDFNRTYSNPAQALLDTTIRGGTPPHEIVRRFGGDQMFSDGGAILLGGNSHLNRDYDRYDRNDRSTVGTSTTSNNTPSQQSIIDERRALLNNNPRQ